MRFETSVSITLLLALLTAGIARAESTTIVVESAAVRADDLSFDVRLETDTEVSGTLNDVVFDPPGLVGVRANGRPQCVVNDSIEKGGTAFTFLPAGCTPGVS